MTSSITAGGAIGRKAKEEAAARKALTLARRKARSHHSSLLAVVEGVAEQHFLEALRPTLRAKRCNLSLVQAGGAERMRHALAKSKPETYDHVLLMMDADQPAVVRALRQVADDHHHHMVVSQPCFERTLWDILAVGGPSGVVGPFPALTGTARSPKQIFKEHFSCHAHELDWNYLLRSGRQPGPFASSDDIMGRLARHPALAPLWEKLR
ncbi:RloB domain-containing protein [Formicincola oecophyllae]|uniref:RloB domain-containing protein n=1 Tax=Formicincola oecophyllae TaxID=2558361 RepID=A0A4Y6UA76_9PROT|nr:RloB domain-containing protein [Formicincola oecophyllae]QDH13055.1 RloB domain-containing protein [Formicincola oecophyllae]